MAEQEQYYDVICGSGEQRCLGRTVEREREPVERQWDEHKKEVKAPSKQPSSASERRRQLQTLAAVSMVVADIRGRRSSWRRLRRTDDELLATRTDVSGWRPRPDSRRSGGGRCDVV